MSQQRTASNSMKQSQSNWQSAQQSQRKAWNGKLIPPEENWELIGNPSIYLDELPQPYKFINNCLDLMIMKPVFNQITLIEEKKKTPEYEGYLKEVPATGFLEIEGITTISQISVAVTGGGTIDKEGSTQLQNKVLIGDKFGNIHLFDSSRKLVLDKLQVYDSRRIENISASSIVWLDTKLTYAAIIARGSPFVKIVVFKNNENKLHLLYNLNVCPQMLNLDNLEQNQDQSYSDLPSEVKISLDCVFMTVISYGGEVKLIKMPSIINPLKDESENLQQTQQLQPPVQTKGNAQIQQQAIILNPSQQNLEEKLILKSDIEHIQVTNLDLNTILICKIQPKKEQIFQDPFSNKDNLQEQSIQKQEKLQTYLLGKERYKDQEGGDAGFLLKKNKIFPQVYFIRTQYCSKSNESQSTRSLKLSFITTGLAISYLNLFEVQIYNIQPPSKENIPSDYSQEYFNKIILNKKLNAKKKVEKSLTSLVKTIRQKEESIKQVNDQQKIAQMTQSMQGVVRHFKMPYQISASAYQMFDENYQSLAIGLVDGAIIIIDLILGIVKKFLEKHPSEITSIAFWEDKTLISGSIDGRINLYDLEDESENSKIYKCQNCQDRKIPIAKVLTSEFGIGIAVDIEGHCRFYDLIRQKKISKVSSQNTKDQDTIRFASSNKCKWRLLPQIPMEVTLDTFLAVIQSIYAQIPDQLRSNDSENCKYLIENRMLIDKKNTDIKENLKSLRNIVDEQIDLPFFIQKSCLSIFRFEEVIFNLFPNIASLKRKGMNTKEIFLKTDPSIQQNQINQPNILVVEKRQDTDANNTSKSQIGIMKQPRTMSVITGQTNKKSENLGVNFNLQGTGKDSMNKEYDIPTLKRLNPELYKEYAKQQRQMKDPIYQSLQHLKERYGYHEMRQQRIQKRTEEVAKELEARNEEEIMKTRKKNMRSTNNR